MSITQQTDSTTDAIEGCDRFSSHRYVSPTPGQLPLIALYPENATEKLDDNHYARLRLMGFNSVITKGTEAELVKRIQTLYDNGMVAIPEHEIYTGKSEEMASNNLKGVYTPHYRNRKSR